MRHDEERRGINHFEHVACVDLVVGHWLRHPLGIELGTFHLRRDKELLWPFRKKQGSRIEESAVIIQQFKRCKQFLHRHVQGKRKLPFLTGGTDEVSHLRNAQIEKISCLYEKSCGAIVIYKDGDKCKILLVRNHNGRNYSFPKGHVEQGETEQETAVREVYEETGLTIRIIDSFREVADYCPFGKIRKRVVFFMAQTMSDKVKIQEEEIDSYIWVDLDQAHHRCTYDNDLRVIRKARENIDKLI